jgi:hypothetical protein
MGAGGGLVVVYVEEVLVEWGMACAKLCDDGRLVMVEFINKLQEFVRGEGFINGVEEGVSGRGFSVLLPEFMEGHWVGLVQGRDTCEEGFAMEEGGEESGVAGGTLGS